MLWFVGDIFMSIITLAMMVFLFFMFDDIILRGYFATKLRKRFDVESLK